MDLNPDYGRVDTSKPLRYMMSAHGDGHTYRARLTTVPPGYREVTREEYQEAKLAREQTLAVSVLVRIDYASAQKLKANAKKAGKRHQDYAAEILEWYLRKV